MQKPYIDLSDDFFGAVLNCAVRYSLGRFTYMPSLVIDYITPLLPYLSGKTLSCMERDITEWLKSSDGTESTAFFYKDVVENWHNFLSCVRLAIEAQSIPQCKGCEYEKDHRKCAGCCRNTNQPDYYKKTGEQDPATRPCDSCVNNGWSMPQCHVCNAQNGYEYYEREINK